ncbi:MAG: hypothetical protein ACYC6G_03555 [Desulfobaccales bacterium]
MRIHRLGIVLCGLLVLSACSRAVLQSSVTTQPVDQNITQPDTMGYFLPKGLIRVQLKPDPVKTNDLQLTTSVRYIQDPGYFFTLKYLPMTTFDDNIDVKLTELGFLDAIVVTTTDKKREIVGKVIEIAKEIAKITTFPGTVAKLEAKGKVPNIDVEFDPDLFLNAERKTERRVLEDRFFKPYNIKVNLERTFPGGNFTKQGPTDQKGIYYRPLLPYELSVECETEAIYKNETILLPNEAPIMAIDLTRGAFIKKAMTLNFKNGILTQITVDKPSEVSAALDIPLDIAKAIVSLPTELIQFKMNYSSENKKLYDALLQEIQAKDALIDYLHEREGKGKGAAPK